MNFDINKIIYVYLFVCSVLLVLNILYIFISKWRTDNYSRYSHGWSKVIKKQIDLLNTRNFVERVHKKRLEKRLTNTQQLISYAHALDILRGKGIDTKDYLMKNYVSIQSLSYKYKKKEVYDRAFFGFFISNNAPCDGSDYNSLM